jgi:cell division protein FtsL
MNKRRHEEEDVQAEKHRIWLRDRFKQFTKIEVVLMLIVWIILGMIYGWTIRFPHSLGWRSR